MKAVIGVICLASALVAADLPKIAVLATGGTIASNKGQSLFSGESLVAAVPALHKLAEIQTEQVVNIGSRDMTPAIWLKLAKRTNELLANPSIAGIVITHGTDTLEETAFFLDLTAIGRKPVVFVAAQRPASEPDSDGPRNLLDAVRVAASPQAIGKGVLVVLNGQIHAARDVMKTHTSQVETFRSLEFGQLGVVDAEVVRFYRSPLQRQTFSLTNVNSLPRVEIIYNYAGADGRLITALLNEPSLGGIVVAGLGLGNVTSGMADQIEAARKRQIPIVIGTRVPSGRIFSQASDRSSALGLKQIGCVLAGNLSPQKARVLLMLALTQTTEPAKLQNYFEPQ